ncbi:MAG: hypothetical protein EA411_05130 [Saprospirales bacterium]|nr:MAG: hypothetical protein EA411_05130 [Saprospirales bacterium]
MLAIISSLFYLNELGLINLIRPFTTILEGWSLKHHLGTIDYTPKVCEFIHLAPILSGRKDKPLFIISQLNNSLSPPISKNFTINQAKKPHKGI